MNETEASERDESFAARLPSEAGAIVGEAERRGKRVRLLGGVAIKLLLGARLDAAFDRKTSDIDVICARRDGSAVETLLTERGWEPATQFNALNGSSRLLFHDPRSEAQVDVFVGEFSMCHVLPLTESLDGPGPSLPATDLVMTKLQIVELNAKDRGDLYSLLVGCDLGAEAADVDPRRIAALTGRDWGLHHTCERNLGLLRERVGAGEGPALAGFSIDAITAAMESEPKARGWKVRACIGERKRWYELPEEVDRGD